MDHPAMDHPSEDRRKGLRRTVTVLVSIVVLIFLLTFVQILLMK